MAILNARKHRPKTSPMTTKSYFSQLTILFFALVAGQLLFVGVAFFLNQQGSIEPLPELEDIMKIIVPLAAVAAVGGSTFLGRGLLAQIPKDSGLKKKLNQYRSAFIVKMAMHEGVSLLAIVTYMLTGQVLFLAVSGVIIALQMMMTPKPERTIEELGLTGEEKATLQRADGLIS